MVTHAARPLPGCGPVDVVHVENSAVAVDAGLPVWSDREGGVSGLKNDVCGAVLSSVSVLWSIFSRGGVLEDALSPAALQPRSSGGKV